MAGVTPTILVLPGQLQQRLSKDILVLLRSVVVAVDDALARFRVELSRCVPDSGTLLGRLIAFTLDGMQVQEFRTFHVLYLAEYPNKFYDIVSVERSEIPYVHTLEDILLMADGTLQSVVQTDDALAALIGEHSLRVQPLAGLKAQAVVGLVGIEIQKITLHTTDGAVDGHIVVVEDYQQVIGLARHIIESLVGQSATHSAVANDSHHVAVLML